MDRLTTEGTKSDAKDGLRLTQGDPGESCGPSGWAKEARLPASIKRAHYLDDEVTGFGLRISNGPKSFFWRKKVNGEVIFRALGEFPSITVKDARDAARELSGKAAEWARSGYAGESPFKRKDTSEPADVPTFQQLLDAYVERHVRETANHPERAEYAARWAAKRYLAAWTARPITEITVDDMLTVKNACGKKKYAANRAVEFVRALYNWSAGRTDGKINFGDAGNPAKHVSCYDEKPREKYLEPLELDAFNKALDTEPHHDLKDFLVLAMNTGARKNDLLSMRWCDVQWERETWRVAFPKNGESYDVSLLPAALETLRRRRRETPESEPYVFPGPGASRHLTDLKKPWEAFRTRAGLGDIGIHDIRRTVGSYLAISDISL